MSLPAVSTSSEAGSDIGGTKPSQQQTVGRTQAWEEPHPGVPIPLEEPNGIQASTRSPSEAWRGDMAAKGYGYFRARSGVARRYSRPGMRPRLTKSSRTIQHISPDETVMKTGNIMTTIIPVEPTQFELTPTPDGSTNCPTPITIAVDGNNNEVVDLGGPETPSPSCGYRSLSLDLTDFSDHINKALEGGDSNASSLTVCDLGLYTQAAPELDLYGWEAELKRKLERGCDSSVVCACLGEDRRQHPRHKRNLLQRVFSLGEGSPQAE